MESQDRGLFERFGEEFKALKGKPFILETTALHAWLIMAQLQLALRHPQNKGPSSNMVREICNKIIEVVAPPGTALREVADRGWDTKYDN
jgi:hypothetical protein